MYTRKIYSLTTLLKWTRNETAVFAVIASIPVIAFEVLEQHWFFLPWLPIALVGTAVAFILGFQNNATYDRIWEARKIWGGIVNTSRAWALMVNDFITTDFVPEGGAQPSLAPLKKRLILRHVAWTTALRHAMRESRPWEHVMKARSNREWNDMIQVHEHTHSLEDDLAGYLDDAESNAVLTKTNKPAQILALQSTQLRQLRQADLIDDFRHMAMEKTLVELMGLQGRSERIKNFPYPRQYATLNAVFVWIFLLLLPLGLVNEFHKIGTSLSIQELPAGQYFIWLSIPFSVLVMWVFHTMERVGRSGENPFEGSPNDVPITTMSRGIEIDMRQIIDDDPGSIPGPIEAKHSTQS